MTVPPADGPALVAGEAADAMRSRPRRRLGFAAGLLRAAAPRIDAVEDELAALPDLVRPGDVCLDVGAKHGAYALVLAAAAGDAGRVIAFEPLPGPARVVRAARRLLGARNVTLVRAAVSDVAGAGTMRLPVRRGIAVPGRTFLADDTDGLGSNVEFRRHRSVAAPVVTLDGWCAAHGVDRVDVVKVDVEGAEARVLDGARGLLARWRPMLLVELEDRHLRRFRTSAAEVFARLRALGYEAAVLADGTWRTVDAPSADVRNHRFRHPSRPG